MENYVIKYQVPSDTDNLNNKIPTNYTYTYLVIETRNPSTDTKILHYHNDHRNLYYV